MSKKNERATLFIYGCLLSRWDIRVGVLDFNSWPCITDMLLFVSHPTVCFMRLLLSEF